MINVPSSEKRQPHQVGSAGVILVKHKNAQLLQIMQERSYQTRIRTLLILKRFLIFFSLLLRELTYLFLQLSHSRYSSLTADNLCKDKWNSENVKTCKKTKLHSVTRKSFRKKIYLITGYGSIKLMPEFSEKNEWSVWLRACVQSIGTILSKYCNNSLN